MSGKLKRKFESHDEISNPALKNLFSEYSSDDADKFREEWLIDYLSDERASLFFDSLIDEDLNETFENFNQWYSIHDFIEFASELGHLYIVKPAIDYLVLVDYDELHEVITDSILAAANNNHFKIVTYLLQYVAANFHDSHKELVNEVFQVLARTGKIKAIQFFMDSNLPIDPSEAIYEASGQLPTIKFIAANTKVSLNMREINNVVKESNNLEVVQFLIEQLGADPTAGNNQCIRSACVSRNYGLVFYLASIPKVLTALDADHKYIVENWKNYYKSRYHHELSKYKTNFCTFFSPFSDNQNLDVQSLIGNLGLALIQKESGLNDQALEFILK